MTILNINIWSIKAWRWLWWIYLWLLRTIKQVKCTPWRWFQFKLNLRLGGLSVRSKLSQYHFCWRICLVSPGYQQPWCWLSKLEEYFISGRKKLNYLSRYSDVIMSTEASPFTGASIVYLTVFHAEIKENMKAPHYWPFVRGIHRWLVDSPHKGPVTRKMFPFDEVILWMQYGWMT